MLDPDCRRDDDAPSDVGPCGPPGRWSPWLYALPLSKEATRWALVTARHMGPWMVIDVVAPVADQRAMHHPQRTSFQRHLTAPQIE